MFINIVFLNDNEYASNSLGPNQGFFIKQLNLVVEFWEIIYIINII